MSLSKSIKKHRCASFTLIEAVVAIIIVLACFWLSGMIYVNLLRSDARAERLRAFVITKSIVVETNKQHSFFDEGIEIDSLLSVKKTVEPYQGDTELKILTLEAFNKTSQKLVSCKQIIIAE